MARAGVLVLCMFAVHCLWQAVVFGRRQEEFVRFVTWHDSEEVDLMQLLGDNPNLGRTMAAAELFQEAKEFLSQNQHRNAQFALKAAVALEFVPHINDTWNNRPSSGVPHQVGNSLQLLVDILLLLAECSLDLGEQNSDLAEIELAFSAVKLARFVELTKDVATEIPDNFDLQVLGKRVVLAAAKVLTSLRVADLKKLLSARGLECLHCKERSLFLEVLASTLRVPVQVQTSGSVVTDKVVNSVFSSGSDTSLWRLLHEVLQADSLIRGCTECQPGQDNRAVHRDLFGFETAEAFEAFVREKASQHLNRVVHGEVAQTYGLINLEAGPPPWSDMQRSKGLQDAAGSPGQQSHPSQQSQPGAASTCQCGAGRQGMSTQWSQEGNNAAGGPGNGEPVVQQCHISMHKQANANSQQNQPPPGGGMCSGACPAFSDGGGQQPMQPQAVGCQRMQQQQFYKWGVAGADLSQVVLTGDRYRPSSEADGGTLSRLLTAVANFAAWVADKDRKWPSEQDFSNLRGMMQVMSMIYVLAGVVLLLLVLLLVFHGLGSRTDERTAASKSRQTEAQRRSAAAQGLKEAVASGDVAKLESSINVAEEVGGVGEHLLRKARHMLDQKLRRLRFVSTDTHKQSTVSKPQPRSPGKSGIKRQTQGKSVMPKANPPKVQSGIMESEVKVDAKLESKTDTKVEPKTIDVKSDSKQGVEKREKSPGSRTPAISPATPPPTPPGSAASAASSKQSTGGKSGLFMPKDIELKSITDATSNPAHLTVYSASNTTRKDDKESKGSSNLAFSGSEHATPGTDTFDTTGKIAASVQAQAKRRAYKPLGVVNGGDSARELSCAAACERPARPSKRDAHAAKAMVTRDSVTEIVTGKQPLVAATHKAAASPAVKCTTFKDAVKGVTPSVQVNGKLSEGLRNGGRRRVPEAQDGRAFTVSTPGVNGLPVSSDTMFSTPLLDQRHCMSTPNSPNQTSGIIEDIAAAERQSSLGYAPPPPTSVPGEMYKVGYQPEQAFGVVAPGAVGDAPVSDFNRLRETLAHLKQVQALSSVDAHRGSAWMNGNQYLSYSREVPMEYDLGALHSRQGDAALLQTPLESDAAQPFPGMKSKLSLTGDAAYMQGVSYSQATSEPAVDAPVGSEQRLYAPFSSGFDGIWGTGPGSFFSWQDQAAGASWSSGGPAVSGAHTSPSNFIRGEQYLPPTLLPDVTE